MQEPVVDFEVDAQLMQRIQNIASEIKVMSDGEIDELIRSLNDK